MQNSGFKDTSEGRFQATTWRTTYWPLLPTTSSSTKITLIPHIMNPQSIQLDVLFLGLIHLPTSLHTEYLAMRMWGTCWGDGDHRIIEYHIGRDPKSHLVQDESFPGLLPPLAASVQRDRSWTSLLLWGECNLRDVKQTSETILKKLIRQICVASDALWELFPPTPSFHLI